MSDILLMSILNLTDEQFTLNFVAASVHCQFQRFQRILHMLGCEQYVLTTRRDRRNCQLINAFDDACLTSHTSPKTMPLMQLGMYDMQDENGKTVFTFFFSLKTLFCFSVFCPSLLPVCQDAVGLKPVTNFDIDMDGLTVLHAT